MITAVVMVGEKEAAAGPVAWVQGARQAATRDLLDQLARQPLIGRLLLVSPNAAELATPAVSHAIQTPPGPIHVGRQLLDITNQFNLDRLLYFGGGSAPLLADDTLTEIVTQLASAEQTVLTNNRFASDWAGFAPAAILVDWVEQLPQDNMMGWVLSAEAGLSVQAQPASAAARLDIDTPTDLLTLRLHPAVKPYLRTYLHSLPLDTTPLENALAVLKTPASQVFIAGRFGPDVWQALNRATRSWLRVLSEERGMVSSGRHLRGEVFSLFADHLAAVGLERFFATLPQSAGVAFIDSRVLMAHYGRWPAESDRFASDLGLLDQIEDSWLHDFTAHALACPIPIILGGHGLMAGDMLAFCELLHERGHSL
jgi:hypothetical protein